MKSIELGRTKDNKGQTLIETALVLILLLMILIGIAEYSRAWYRKSSVKNAVRQGARVAAVTATPFQNYPTFTCTSAIITNCTSSPPSDPIEKAVCCQSGVPADTSVTLSCQDLNGSSIDCNSGPVPHGGAVTISAMAPFSTVVPRLFSSLIPTQLSSDATMRYE